MSAASNRFGEPEIFNTDSGSQFTNLTFAGELPSRISGQLSRIKLENRLASPSSKRSASNPRCSTNSALSNLRWLKIVSWL
jgi:hypothetical protein